MVHEPRYLLSKRRDLKEVLSGLGDDPERCFEDSVQLLRAMFHADVGMISKPVKLDTGGFGLEIFHQTGMTPAQRTGAVSLLTAGSPVLAYDPHNPEAVQRNRFIALGHDTGVRAEKLRDADVHSRRLGSSAYHQHRALICDASRFLAWVGILREDPPTSRERHVWGSLIPYFLQALRLEHALREAALAKAGLSGALETLEGLWFVTSKTGRIQHANVAARRVMNIAAKETQARVCAAIQQRDASPSLLADLTELNSAGNVQGFLVRLRSTSSPQARLELARRIWRLTNRQVETLAYVANGDSNKEIADKLGCAIRTAEAHVTALLIGSQSSGRAELVAKFWTLS